MTPQELLSLPMGSGGEDPADPATVQAMQLVLHLPKNAQPTASRADYLAAAGQAVVAVCLDERAATDPEYRAALQRWYGHRIRKVTRRARNAPWEAVQQLPGVTVQVGQAQVRAFLPSAVCEVPPALRKLQIQGTDLPADVPLPEPDPAHPLVLVDQGLGMSLGKAAAQVGHATMLYAAQHPISSQTRWEVREVPSAEFQRWARQAAVVVRDAGFTEVAPQSMTAAAFATRPW